MVDAAQMEEFAERGLHLAAAARAAGVSADAIRRAEGRHGVSLRRIAPGHVLRVDHREVVQDLKPMDAVEYLLDVLEAIIAPVSADVAWEFPGTTMTPQEKRVLRVIALSRVPVNRETLYGALNGDRVAHPMEGNGKIVDVVLCRVRAKVAQFGVRIVNRHGIGWSVEVPRGFVWPWAVAA